MRGDGFCLRQTYLMKNTLALTRAIAPACMTGARYCALALAAVAFLALDASAAPPTSDAVPVHSTQGPTRTADFAAAEPSADTLHVANWIADSGDNQGAPFIVVDKLHARAWVFGADARLRAVSPVLLGLAPGDYSVQGIGLRPMQDILPHERTTPAGRFVAEPGRNLNGEDIIWVDYDAAVSMHRVRPNNPAEKRLERLASPTPNDNRISYGCINVPVAFYETYVSPIFAKGRAIIYVLPDSRTVQAVFGSYNVTIADAEPNDAPSEVATR
ncbi:MAG: hypothetical protein H2060_09110 [Azoarcus sp.]|nr:hypothetical protein [Azoarcus sp.]